MKITLESQLASMPEFSTLFALHKLSKSLGIKLYLVGGSVRDLILERKFFDYDFAVSEDPAFFAKEFSNLIDAKFVKLDEGHLFTSRVIYQIPLDPNLQLKDGRAFAPVIFDFTKFRGLNIIEDLRLRDLSLNAIALDFDDLISNGSAELIDPCSALNDIQGRKVKFVSDRSIVDDPLRMLRAYRIAGDLDFELDRSSRKAIKSLRSLILQSAWERIRDEFLKILSQNESSFTIRHLDEDGILSEILPEVETMRNVTQNRYHHLDVWEHSMLAVELFESNPIPSSLDEHKDWIKDYLSASISGYKRAAWLKFALLLHDAGKPATKSIDEAGRVRFFKHEVEGSKVAAQVSKRFKLSTKSREILEVVIRNHLRTMHLSSPHATKKAVYRFIKNCESEWLGVLLISYSDLCASRGSLRKEEDITRNQKLMSHIIDTYFREILPAYQSPKLLSGTDLIEKLDLKPGPLIGEILDKVEEAKLEGGIRDKDGALKLARKLIKEKGR